MKEALYDMKWLMARFDNEDALKFIYFWGHTELDAVVGKACLSQWYVAPFTVDGLVYQSTEHWMMAHKALLFGDRERFEQILAVTKPAEAKALGKLVQGFDEIIWREHRYDIVRLGNIHKFNQNDKLRAFLLATQSHILVEASPHDEIWGIGLAADSPHIDNLYTWQGENLLGFVLMEVRDVLSELGHFEPLQGTPLPPWRMYPGVHSMDMFWRMGAGEEYVMKMGQYFSGLSARELRIYEMTNPAPYDWRGYYD